MERDEDGDLMILTYAKGHHDLLSRTNAFVATQDK